MKSFYDNIKNRQCFFLGIMIVIADQKIIQTFFKAFTNTPRHLSAFSSFSKS